jgi:hypothetical protein
MGQSHVAELPEDRLAADDEDVGISSDSACRSEYVRQLGPLHDFLCPVAEIT